MREHRSLLETVLFVSLPAVPNPPAAMYLADSVQILRAPDSGSGAITQLTSQSRAGRHSSLGPMATALARSLTFLH
jgi:hypothetical protein